MAKPLSQARGDVLKRLTAVANVHRDPSLARIMGKLGKMAREDAENAARADLGADGAFSGWRRGKPIPLSVTTRYLGKGRQYVGPTGRSAGPWTVAQRGRNADGGVGGFQGPGVNLRTGLTMRTKTGKIRNSRAKARRYNGRTAGMQTATDAKIITKRATPERLKRVSDEALAAAFKKGR